MSQGQIIVRNGKACPLSNLRLKCLGQICDRCGCLICCCQPKAISSYAGKGAARLSACCRALTGWRVMVSVAVAPLGQHACDHQRAVKATSRRHDIVRNNQAQHPKGIVAQYRNARHPTDVGVVSDKVGDESKVQRAARCTAPVERAMVSTAAMAHKSSRKRATDYTDARILDAGASPLFTAAS